MSKKRESEQWDAAEDRGFDKVIDSLAQFSAPLQECKADECPCVEDVVDPLVRDETNPFKDYP